MLPEQALLIVGAAAFGVFILYVATSHRKIAGYCAFAGCAIIILLLAYRWYFTGRPPWAMLSETAALLALITGLIVAWANRRGEPASFTGALAGASAILLLLSAYLWAPGAALPEELESGWLLVHVPIVVLGYGLFATSAMASAAYLYTNLKKPDRRETLARLDRIAYFAAVIGLALLVVGTILGAIWAKAAWGAYWSWDPKETWALITILIYVLYAGLRLRGLKGEDAAYLSILGFLAVLFTYLGVSYLIPGLHSYT